MASGILNTNKEPTSAAWHVYTDFSSDIDLTDGSYGPAGVCARAVYLLDDGVLKVKKPDGQTETITGLVAGMQVAGQMSTIESSGDGTTVTAVIVYW